METNIKKVGYRLVRNGTSTADKAPYLGVAVPVGSLACGNILQRMLDHGTHMTLATAKYFLNEFYEYAAQVIAEDIVRINMGAVSIYPMISGAFDSEDDEFRTPRNTLYVGATLSQEIRDAVSGVLPESVAGIAVGSVAITTVMDIASRKYHLIDGLKEFRIVGIDLTVPDGEDESLALVAADGLTKVADITVVSTEDGQRIVCMLASAVPAGTYYVRLVSHGLDPTAPLSTVLHKVTVKAGETPPAPSTAPSIDNVLQEGEGEGNLNKIVSKDKATNINGANFDGASVTVEFLDHEGEPASFAVGASKIEINEAGTVIAVDSDVLYEVADRKGEGEHITFKVTTSEGETSKEVAWEVE